MPKPQTTMSAKMRACKARCASLATRRFSRESLRARAAVARAAKAAKAAQRTA